MTDEQEQAQENRAYLLMALIGLVAIIISPFVKLKDWLKGERE
jgi:uncharacterized membrane protein YagU involved in acid resistance